MLWRPSPMWRCTMELPRMCPALCSVFFFNDTATTEIYTDLDRSIRHRFGTLGDDARVRRTAAALEANGIRVLRAADAAEAKRIVLGLIPDGSQVHHGASQSLEKSGIAEEIEKSGRYEPLRPRIW